MNWAQQQFGACELGDVRRTRRLVQFAAQVAADPDSSTPNQIEKWSDLKAAYRLVECEDVTFDAVATPHWQLTRQCEPGTYLILCDTTEVDFGAGNEAAGLKSLGNGSGRGFLLHSGLLIEPGSERVRGLAGQVVRYREAVPKKKGKKKESDSGRLARDRESLVWGQLVENIGKPAAGVQYVDVCDRGADNFEVFARMRLQEHDWVVRVAHLTRQVRYDDREQPLSEVLTQLPVVGAYELAWRSAHHGSRRATLEVRIGSVWLPAPRHRSPWLKACGVRAIQMQVIEVREVGAPQGVTPLHWVLYTSLPVRDFAEARTRIGYYEARFVVEEFHKSLKTGCRVESRQYRTSGRLEVITALQSVVAVRLLQVRCEARTNPTRPASELIPARWITTLTALRTTKGKGPSIVTVRDFYRQLAGLGGHLLRKRDGEPGWITLWRGFEKLHLALRTLDAVSEQRKRCG